METYLGMKYSCKADTKIADVEPDDVLPKISEVLAPKGVHSNIDSFVKSLSKDESFKPEGEVIYKFSVDGMSMYVFIYGWMYVSDSVMSIDIALRHCRGTLY